MTPPVVMSWCSCPPRSTLFIKRVVGIPGDRVRYANKTLFVNGKRLNYEFVREFADPGLRAKVREYTEEIDGRRYPIYKTAGIERAQEWTIGDGQYLMIGDNRDRSADSRTWGLASADNIVGKAVAIWAHKPPGWHWPSFDRNRWLSSRRPASEQHERIDSRSASKVTTALGLSVSKRSAVAASVDP